MPSLDQTVVTFNSHGIEMTEKWLEMRVILGIVTIIRAEIQRKQESEGHSHLARSQKARLHYWACCENHHLLQGDHSGQWEFEVRPRICFLPSENKLAETEVRARIGVLIFIDEGLAGVRAISDPLEPGTRDVRSIHWPMKMESIIVMDDKQGTARHEASPPLDDVFVDVLGLPVRHENVRCIL